MKDKVIAALLAFFLGSFGAHKFYLGRTGQGFIYILFCWTFIPTVISFVEFILYLSMSDHAFNAKYNHGEYFGKEAYVNSPTAAYEPPRAQQPHNTSSIATDLQNLKDMKDNGVLNEEEYQRAKGKLLA